MPRIRLTDEEKAAVDESIIADDDIDENDPAVRDILATELDDPFVEFRKSSQVSQIYESEGKNKGKPKKSRWHVAKNVKFTPTDAQRDLVTHMKLLNFSDQKMAALIINPWTQKPIDVWTLHHRFPEELALAKEKLQLKINRSVYMQAVGIDPVIEVDEKTGKQTVIHPGRQPVPIMSIYYEKTRFGYKEGNPISEADTSGQVSETSQPSVIIVLPSNGRDGPRQIEAVPDIIENPAQAPLARGSHNERKSLLPQMQLAEQERAVIIDLPTKKSIDG